MKQPHSSASNPAKPENQANLGRPAQTSSKAPRGAQLGNQNASKHRGGSRRISATVPVDLAEWLAQQPNQSAAVVAALRSFRISVA